MSGFYMAPSRQFSPLVFCATAQKPRVSLRAKALRSSAQKGSNASIRFLFSLRRISYDSLFPLLSMLKSVTSSQFSLWRITQVAEGDGLLNR